MPDGSAVRGGEWATFSVGVSMCMRNPRDSWGSRYTKVCAAEPVYDLLNAGPRTRFMVLGDAGPFVVHNCVENFCQAVARCIIAEQMLRISKRYKVVLTVHDAIAIVAKVEEADTARAFVEENMRWRPSWAQDLPLACESGMGASYGDC